MTTKRVPATPRQIDRLLDEVTAAPGEPLGDHLTDEQLLEYSTSPLGHRGLPEADAHLSSCDECLAHIEELLEIAEAVPRRRESPAARSLTLTRLSRWLYGLPRYPAALSDAAASSLEHASPDGSWHIVIVDDGEQNLRIAVRLSSMELLGERIRIEPFGSSIVLEQVSPAQVGGEVLVPRSKRSDVPMGATVRFSLMAGADQGARAGAQESLGDRAPYLDTEDS